MVKRLALCIIIVTGTPGNVKQNLGGNKGGNNMSGVLLAVVFLAVMYGLYLFDEWLTN